MRFFCEVKARVEGPHVGCVDVFFADEFPTVGAALERMAGEMAQRLKEAVNIGGEFRFYVLSSLHFSERAPKDNSTTPIYFDDKLAGSGLEDSPEPKRRKRR